MSPRTHMCLAIMYNSNPLLTSGTRVIHTHTKAHLKPIWARRKYNDGERHANSKNDLSTGSLSEARPAEAFLTKAYRPMAMPQTV